MSLSFKTSYLVQDSLKSTWRNAEPWSLSLRSFYISKRLIISCHSNSFQTANSPSNSHSIHYRFSSFSSAHSPFNCSLISFHIHLIPLAPSTSNGFSEKLTQIKSFSFSQIAINDYPFKANKKAFNTRKRGIMSTVHSIISFFTELKTQAGWQIKLLSCREKKIAAIKKEFPFYEDHFIFIFRSIFSRSSFNFSQNFSSPPPLKSIKTVFIGTSKSYELLFFLSRLR
jgi:hypothetical protein